MRERRFFHFYDADRESMSATHYFHLSKSYFFTNSSVSLKAICLSIPEMNLSVVSVKNVFKVLLKVV